MSYKSKLHLVISILTKNKLTKMKVKKKKIKKIDLNNKKKIMGECF